MFESLLARDFSDARYFRAHRLLVDAYSLQHPERYCRSAKSLAAHLCGLYACLSGASSASTGPASLQRWLNGRRTLTRPKLPEWRGELTVADVGLDADPLVHVERVTRWAESTWAAYASLQALARHWYEQACAENG